MRVALWICSILLSIPMLAMAADKPGKVRCDEVLETVSGTGKGAAGEKQRPPERKDSGAPGSSAVTQFTRDVTQMARDGKLDTVIGRQSETEKIIRTMLRRSKNNVILLGDGGVGKTALVERLAQAIAAGEVPPQLKGKRILELNLSAMKAGTGIQGDFEARFKSLLEEISDGNTILFIDEIHTIANSGSNGSQSTSLDQMLKPFLARPGSYVIGATTTPEYRTHLEPDTAFGRRFRNQMVDEPSVSETQEILTKGVAPSLEKHYTDLKIGPDAVAAAAPLSANGRVRPDYPKDLLDEAGSLAQQEYGNNGLSEKLAKYKELQAKQRALLHPAPGGKMDVEAGQALTSEIAALRRDLDAAGWDSASGRLRVTEDHVRRVYEEQTGVRLPRKGAEEADHWKNMAGVLSSKVPGQNKNMQELADTYRMGMLPGMRETNKTRAAFLMVGNNDAGVEATAYAMNTFVNHGASSGLLILDGARLSSGETAPNILLGSPAGYKGNEEGGVLSNAISRNPSVIVWVKNVSQASPEALSIVSNMMRQGFVQDSRGKIYKTDKITVLASHNVKAPPAGEERAKTHTALTQYLGEDVVNSFDGTLYFEPVSSSNARSVVTETLATRSQTLENLYGVKLDFEDQAIRVMMEQSKYADQGLGSLHKYFEREVLRQIIPRIESGEVSKDKPRSFKVKNKGDQLVVE